MSTEPPAKRQRTEDESAPAPNEDNSPQKSYLWFDDGNVVLQAEKTLFRVHKTVLALHSDVFSDMFNICQSPADGSQPMFEDGCPLISTSDSAADLTYLLSNIYENQKKHNLGKEIEATRAVALYRLGNKYGMDYLCDDILLRLKTAFPSTLQDFHLRRGQTKATFPPAVQDFMRDHKSTMHPFGKLGHNDLIRLANLAHDFGILIVLPAIYARLARLSNDAILSLSRKSKPVGLKPDIINTCLSGKEKMASAIQRALFLRANSCNSIRTCDRRPRCAISTSDILWHLGISVCEQGIRCFDIEKIRESTDRGWCEGCMRTVLMMEYEPMLQELWANLPSYFGLPTWEELKSSTS
ncbi:hypothetical protein CPC08DRAFT_696043 [Agrocybe pediades]|nr:hypothetical protein CPC08DRAFT_696043 [Agrocybe pediades]